MRPLCSEFLPETVVQAVDPASLHREVQIVDQRAKQSPRLPLLSPFGRRTTLALGDVHSRRIADTIPTPEWQPK